MSEADITVDAGGGRQQRIRVDYPSNSKTPKPAVSEKPKLEKIVEGEVRTRKPSLFRRVTHDFISEDGPSVMQYVVLEVMMPAAKNLISDVVSQGIERMLYGDSRPSRSSGRPGYTNYSRPPGAGRSIPMSDPRPALSRQARANHDFGEIILATRAEAEDVLEQLRELINQYEIATVSDLYQLVGHTGEFTDDKWGWDDLRSASIRPIRGGYLLNMPRTQPIV
jgi:hypothetical protein